MGSGIFFQFFTCFPRSSEVTKADACADPKDCGKEQCDRSG